MDNRNKIFVCKSDDSKEERRQAVACDFTDFAWTAWSFKFMKRHELCNTTQVWSV